MNIPYGGVEVEAVKALRTNPERNVPAIAKKYAY